MDTLQLKLFISVSQTLNFTKTAAEFYMTQPTVSNYIKSLEKDIGVKLLNRDSHSVSLTAEGVEFADYASRILTLQLEAETRLRNISKGRRGYIHIAMLSSTMELFSECLSEFNHLHPDIQVDVDIKEGTEMIKALNQHAYDLYFANQYMMPDNIEYIITATQQLRLYAHLSAAAEINANEISVLPDWSFLNRYRFVSVPENDFALSGQIQNICSSRGFTPDIINYYNRADTLLLAVNSNIGLTILPPGLSYFYTFPNICSFPIAGTDAAITSVTAWHKDRLNPDTKKFLSLNALQHITS